MCKMRQILFLIGPLCITVAFVIACGAPEERLQSGGGEVRATATTQGSPTAEVADGGALATDSAPIAGSEAIHPTLAAKPGKPTFTEDDVRAWVADNPPAAWDSTTPPPVVERVEFLPAREVAAKVNHPVYAPDDAILCLATLSGTWAPELPPGVKPSGSPIPNTVIYLIFDGTTGNLLGMTSGVDSSK